MYIPTHPMMLTGEGIATVKIHHNRHFETSPNEAQVSVFQQQRASLAANLTTTVSCTSLFDVNV
jgi:hypothetical protein